MEEVWSALPRWRVCSGTLCEAKTAVGRVPAVWAPTDRVERRAQAVFRRASRMAAAPVRSTQLIAIVGSGLIGKAWAMVFARAGHRVKMCALHMAVSRHMWLVVRGAVVVL